MALSRIRLELARTPEHPQGSSEHGYVFHAPLDGDGHLDAVQWRTERKRCTVTRFWKGEPDEHGHLVHTQGRRWVFHYDLDSEPEDDEAGFKFDRHTFVPGDYVSVTEHDGETRAFYVESVIPLTR